jgi:hypothetical protein
MYYVNSQTSVTPSRGSASASRAGWGRSATGALWATSGRAAGPASATAPVPHAAPTATAPATNKDGALVRYVLALAYFVRRIACQCNAR